MKLAIVADWLPVYAGAEHVIAEFHTLWPDAPLFTTIANRSKLGPLADADIRTGSLQKWYTLTGKHQWLLPWMPKAIESVDLRGYDVVLSSSHAIGKGIVPPSTAKHVCYCHTPMRYAWEMEDEYLEDFRIPHCLRRMIKHKLKQLRRWDIATGKRVDTFIANSTTIQERIQRTYNRDAVVITPPVSDRFFASTPNPSSEGGGESPLSRGEGVRGRGDYYVSVGRLVPYKRNDLLIEAANRLQLPLKIAGSGSEFEKLKAMAGPTVEMLGFVQDEDLPQLYGNAKAFLFAPFEDAGVVPIEAQASGTPVIAYGKGGVLDTVIDGTTGTFFGEQTADSVCDAIQRFKKMDFDTDAIRAHAAQFTSSCFQKKLLEVFDNL